MTRKDVYYRLFKTAGSMGVVCSNVVVVWCSREAASVAKTLGWAPPYPIMGRDEVSAVLGRNTQNGVGVTLPTGWQEPEGTRPYGWDSGHNFCPGSAA